jgi:hypothetical protein
MRASEKAVALVNVRREQIRVREARHAALTRSGGEPQGDQVQPLDRERQRRAVEQSPQPFPDHERHAAVAPDPAAPHESATRGAPTAMAPFSASPHASESSPCASAATTKKDDAGEPAEAKPAPPGVAVPRGERARSERGEKLGERGGNQPGKGIRSDGGRLLRQPSR